MGTYRLWGVHGIIRWYILIALGSVAVVVAALFFYTIKVDAVGGGGAGGGGSAGGKCTDSYPCSDNGYGWYIYDINSTGPKRFRDNTVTWDYVKGRCQGYSTSVAVFIVFDNDGGAWGYNYNSSWTANYKYSPAYNDPTPGYVGPGKVKQKFDALDTSLKVGTWGSTVSWVCYGTLPPPATSWDAKGTASVSAAEVYPGETVQYTYTIKNIGDGPVSNLSWSTKDETNNVNVSTGTVTLSAGATSSSLPSAGESFTVPTDATPGSSKYCRHIEHANSQNDSRTESSASACITVKSNYDLYPGVTGGGSSGEPLPLTPGGSTTLTGIVDNKGYPVDRDAPYEFHQFVITGDKAKPDFSATFTETQGSYKYKTTTHTNGQGCSVWMSGQYPGTVSACRLLETGNLKDTPSGPKTLGNFTINADDYSPGDWICQFVSVGMYKYGSLAADAHRVSYPVCIVIAKRPMMQVWGHDVRVGDGYDASMLSNSASVRTGWSYSTSKTRTYGSWAEYGIFAPSGGAVVSASGGALSGKDGKAGAVGSTDQLNALTFANTGTASGYGYWAPPSMMASLVAAANRLPKITDITQASVVLQSGLVSIGAGEVKVVPVHAPVGQTSVKLSGQAPSGAGTIILADTTIVIDGDITTNPDNQVITRIGGAAQLVIIAPKIIIQNDVENIDAWLVAVPKPDDPTNTAYGVISTCDAVVTPNYFDNLRLGGDCDKHPLRINGAVFAREVQFRRTYGGDKTSLTTPAEVINLRADAFMWGKGANLTVGGGGTPIETTFTSELPPRF